MPNIPKFYRAKMLSTAVDVPFLSSVMWASATLSELSSPLPEVSILKLGPLVGEIFRESIWGIIMRGREQSFFTVDK